MHNNVNFTIIFIYILLCGPQFSSIMTYFQELMLKNLNITVLCILIQYCKCILGERESILMSVRIGRKKNYSIYLDVLNSDLHSELLYTPHLFR